MLRGLTDDESGVVDRLLSRPFPGRDELVQQLRFVRAPGLSCTCGCPSIALEVDRGAPSAAVAERAPTEAVARDGDDNLVGIMLLVDDDGYMSELEFYSLAGPQIGFPRLDSLTFVEWSEPDATGTRTQLTEMPPPSG